MAHTRETHIQPITSYILLLLLLYYITYYHSRRIEYFVTFPTTRCHAVRTENMRRRFDICAVHSTITISNRPPSGMLEIILLRPNTEKETTVLFTSLSILRSYKRVHHSL